MGAIAGLPEHQRQTSISRRRRVKEERNRVSATPRGSSERAAEVPVLEAAGVRAAKISAQQEWLCQD